MSNEAEVFVKGNPKDPIKIVVEGDMKSVKLIIPCNNPDSTVDDIEITPYQILEILRVNHLTCFFQKKS